MKNGIKHLVGKRITGVVAARGHTHDRDQVFLLLEDGSRFEFHGDSFTCAAALDRSTGLFGSIRDGGGRVTQAYGLDDDQVAEAIEAATRRVKKVQVVATLPARSPLSTRRLLERDLAAWQAAKACVEKARNG